MLAQECLELQARLCFLQNAYNLTVREFGCAHGGARLVCTPQVSTVHRYNFLVYLLENKLGFRFRQQVGFGLMFRETIVGSGLPT